MIKKEDLRIRKTKANLYKGLLQLMEYKTFEEIKVIDICKISLINRSTFYDHFNDKYELLSSLLKDMNKQLIEHLNKTKSSKNIKEYYLNLIKELIDYIKKNLNIYSSIAIIKNNNNSIAHDMMFDATVEAITKRLKEEYVNTSEIPIETIALFYASGVINVCINEVNNNYQNFDEEKILKELDILIPELSYLEPIK